MLLKPRRQLQLARRLLAPGATVITSTLAILTTLVLVVGSEVKDESPVAWLAVDAAIAGLCALCGIVFAGSGSGDVWDALVAIVTALNFVFNLLRLYSSGTE